MMRRTSVVVVLALAGAACGNKSSSAPAPGSGSAPAPASATPPAASATPPGAAPAAGSASATPPAAALDAAALDAAIAAHSFNPRSVRQRAIGPRSAWAIIQAPRDAAHNVVELDLLRLRADGAEVLKLTPPARANPTRWDNDIEPLDVRDLDGDGHDDCVIALRWLQDLGTTGQGESAKQLYVIADGA
ncbi:MAG TPA: hypothetical protein VGC42_29850, partial [Kofleriaceae bacterium]